MRKSVIALAILLASGLSVASPGNGGDNGNGTPGGNSSAASTSRSAGGNALATGGTSSAAAMGGQGGAAGAFAGLNSSTELVVNTTPTLNPVQQMYYVESSGVDYSGSYEMKHAPDVVGSNVQASAGCRNPLNASGSWIGAGFAIGTTYLDETCVKFETVRLAYASPNPILHAKADKVLEFDLDEYIAENEEKKAKRLAKKVVSTQSEDFASTEVADTGFDIMSYNDS